MTHDHKGYSEEKCLRCGWVMGSPPLNCNNDNTPHEFPSHAAARADERMSWGEHLARTQITHVDLANESAAKYLEGQRDEREACIAVVKALPCDSYEITVSRQTVIAAIDAREEKS